jgi:hypothetical protein
VLAQAKITLNGSCLTVTPGPKCRSPRKRLGLQVIQARLLFRLAQSKRRRLTPRRARSGTSALSGLRNTNATAEQRLANFESFELTHESGKAGTRILGSRLNPAAIPGYLPVGMAENEDIRSAIAHSPSYSFMPLSTEDSPVLGPNENKVDQSFSNCPAKFFLAKQHDVHARETR